MLICFSFLSFSSRMHIRRPDLLNFWHDTASQIPPFPVHLYERRILKKSNAPLIIVFCTRATQHSSSLNRAIGIRKNEKRDTALCHREAAQRSISPSAMASRCFVVLAFLLPPFRFFAALGSGSTGVAVPEALLPSSKWPSPCYNVSL